MHFKTKRQYRSVPFSEHTLHFIEQIFIGKVLVQTFLLNLSPGYNVLKATSTQKDNYEAGRCEATVSELYC